MTHVSVAIENGDCEFETLGLDFPVLIFADGIDLFCDIEDAVGVESGNSVEHIERVNSNIDLRIVKTNERIVEEYIEPLLVEHLFVRDKECMAAVDGFIALEILLQGLNYFDSEL